MLVNEGITSSGHSHLRLGAALSTTTNSSPTMSNHVRSLSSSRRDGHYHLLQDETDVISTLTGFSLNNVLQGLSLPTGSGLTSSLGITGLPALDVSQIYNDKWDEDEEAVGIDQGEDYEDEVDRELENESFAGDVVKLEAQSPVSMRLKEKRVRIVKRLVERPRTVYERFPGFEKDKVLDFSDLFKGYTGKKSRITKRPLTGQ